MLRKKPSPTNPVRQGRPSSLYPTKDDGSTATASTASISLSSSSRSSPHITTRNSPLQSGFRPSHRVERERVRPPKKLGVASFKDYYVLTRKIDSGAFSTVYEAAHRFNSTRFAVKVIDRRHLTRQSDFAVIREAKILQRLHASRKSPDSSNSKSHSLEDTGTTADTHQDDHGIVRLVDFFIEPTRFFLVMEYMAGGSVFDRVLERQCYSEGNARKFAVNLLKTLRYMHSLDIAHRDLKPQNLLLGSHNDDTGVKICDFGFGVTIRPTVDKNGQTNRKVLKQKCGTPSYVAPEVLSGNAYDGTKSDMWSFGVIMYFIIGGYPPFIDNHCKSGLFTQIRRGDYAFHETDWKGVSSEAKDFISALLTVDPNSRITAAEALSHPWIRGTVRAGNARIEKDLRPAHSCKRYERTSRERGERRKVSETLNGTNTATERKNEDDEGLCVHNPEKDSSVGRTRVLSHRRRNPKLQREEAPQ